MMVIIVSGCTGPESVNHTTNSSKLTNSIEKQLNLALENYTEFKNNAQFKKLVSDSIYRDLTPYGTTDKDVLSISVNKTSDTELKIRVHAYDNRIKSDYYLELIFNQKNGEWTLDETTGNRGALI